MLAWWDVEAATSLPHDDPARGSTVDFQAELARVELRRRQVSRFLALHCERES